MLRILIVVMVAIIMIVVLARSCIPAPTTPPPTPSQPTATPTPNRVMENQIQSILDEEKRLHPGTDNESTQTRIQAAIQRIDDLTGKTANRWSASISSPKTIDFGKKSYVWMTTAGKQPKDGSWLSVEGYTIGDYGIWVVSGRQTVYNSGAGIVIEK